VTRATCCPDVWRLHCSLRRYPDNVGINVDHDVGPMEIVVTSLCRNDIAIFSRGAAKERGAAILSCRSAAEKTFRP